MDLRGKLFVSRPTLIAVLAACVFESVVSARSLGRPATSLHDAVHTYGLIASATILTALALRVKFASERFLIGAMALAMSLWAGLAVILPTPGVVEALRWLILAAWVASVAAASAMLVRPPRPGNGKRVAQSR